MAKYEDLPQDDYHYEENRKTELCGDKDTFLATESRTRYGVGWKLNIIFIFALLTSLAQNGILYRKTKVLEKQVTIGISPYSGLPSNVPVTYVYHNDWWGENETLANELWESINVDAQVVALSLDYVAEHNLPESDPFPWDTERRLYFPKVFHSLHCLKNVRRAFKDHENGKKSVVPSEHVYHCLDSLRQDITCIADDTPMPGLKPKGSTGIGDTQSMQCRDIEQVRKWATSPENGACFRVGDEYRPVAHNLERHAFCPENSPYYPVAKEYFEKHGHKDTWSYD